MITLEQYADLCAQIAETGADPDQELALAAAQGVTAAQWLGARAHYTAKLCDPDDPSRTTHAFMPLYQAAQARRRSETAPCTLEIYTRVHAELAFRRASDGTRLDYHAALAAHGYTHQAWLRCEAYWMPRVASNVDPRFDIAHAMQFRALMQAECDRIMGGAR